MELINAHLSYRTGCMASGRRMMKKEFTAKGTTCKGCEKTIIEQAKKVKGVRDVRFDYAAEKGHVIYDPEVTDMKTILSSIEEKGYICSQADGRKTWGALLVVAGLLVAAYFLSSLQGSMPSISRDMSYGLLFVVGLITGLHCISMCGGFVISYTAANSGRFAGHLYYAAGKTLSYTLIGALFGFAGSLIAFTPQLRAIAGICAGAFLLVYGLKTLNLLPFLRRFSLSIPGIGLRSNRPLVVGLLNGLMIACGPLQALYVMAAGTGSALEGGKLLLIFGIGTLPALIGFGIAASLISARLTQKMLKASGAIIIVLGLIMINNSLALAGISISQEGSIDAQEALAGAPGVQEIRMKVTARGYEPNSFVLKKDIPVRWIVEGIEITGCNNAIQVPAYDLYFDVREGEQVIEFTPTKEGVVRWSCWMGMLRGSFIVKAPGDIAVASEPYEEYGGCVGSCGGSCGGGCGCGR